METKTLCNQLLAHWLLLVIVACGLLALSLVQGIGLGGKGTLFVALLLHSHYQAYYYR